jgi:hypothetical protein
VIEAVDHRDLELQDENGKGRGIYARREGGKEGNGLIGLKSFN